MGIVFNVPMREDQVGDKIKSETDKAILNDIRGTITLESSQRQAADNEIQSDLTVLRSALDGEIINREESELDIRRDFLAAMNSETALRESGDTALGQALTQSVAELTSSLDAEKTARISGDTAVIQSVENNFNPKISNLTTALNNEVTLSANRDATMYAELTASIAAVNTSQGGGVASLKSALDSETSTRQKETASLGSALSKEVADRQSAVTGIQNQISSAVANEASTRSAADSALQNSLASAQSNLNSVIANEASSRSSADAALQTAINSMQTNLSTALSSEATARAAADTSLQNSISSAVSNISESLKPFTPSTTVAAGKAGFVPAPPKLSTGNEVLILTNKGFQTLADSNIIISAIPSQGAIPNYTGNSITPQWINYENQKITISGETSGVDAKTYTVKFKPIGIYHWADGTQAEKSVTWKINPQVAQIPSASTTSFTFDGSAKTLSVNNPNSNASSQTGTVSATNAGNYTVTYKLKSTTNYVWSDGTTTDKSIAWKINVLKLAKPTASTVTFTYDGNNKSPSISNFNATYENKSGTDTAKAAASYFITFSLKNTANTTWADGTTANVVINWTINKVQVTIPTAAVTSFDFTNSEITLNVNNPDSTYINQSGTAKASAVGTYTLTYTLKDTANYIWRDNTNTAKTITWEIKQVTFPKPAASVTTFTYNQNSQGPTIANYDATYMTKTGTDTAVAAGTYTLTFALKDKTNHKWTDGTNADVVISWTINVLLLDKPTASTKTFEYNETLRTLSVTNYNSNYENISGTTGAIDAGSYSATYSLKDSTNTKWTGNTTADVTINWTITRKPLTAAQSSFHSDDAYTTIQWDGTEHSATEFIFSSVDNSKVYDAKYFDLSSDTSATENTSYRVGITPKANYAWNNGTYATKYISWSIIRRVIDPPTAAITEFEYTGSLITLPLEGFDAAIMEYYETTANYVHSAQKVGNYKALFKLKDSHYRWSVSVNFPSIDWKITTKYLPLPEMVGDTSFVYTGKTIAPNIINYDPTWMSQTGNASAIDVGNYKVTYALTDTGSTSTSANNTLFSNGSKFITFSWAITRKALTEAQSTGFAQAKPLTYNGEVQTVTITNFDPTLHNIRSGRITATNAGTYSMLIEPNSNYTWADGGRGDKKLSWTIDKKSVAIPAFLGASAFVYDGSTKSPQFQNFNTDEVRIASGTTEAVEKGSYKITLALQNTTNYQWADGTTANKTYSWAITAKLLAKPTRTDSNAFTYNGNAKTITVANYDSSTMIFDGTLSEINAGNYTATYSIKDLANYAWSDGTTADVVINWSIARQKFSAVFDDLKIRQSYSNYSGSAFLCVASPDGNYYATAHTLYILRKVNGEWRNFTNEVESPRYFVRSGDTAPKEVGEYVLKVSPTSNYLWSDGTTTPHELPFEITRVTIPKPYIDGDSVFEYDGNAKTVVINSTPNYLPNNNVPVRSHKVTGTKSATNVGTYQIVASLDSKTGFVWDDGTTDDVTLTWEIKQGDGLSKPYLKTPTVAWNGGNNVSPSIGNYDSNLMTQSGTTSAKDLGSYTITYALKDKSNYKWADGTTGDVTLTWQIVRKRMTEAQSTPYATTEYTYNGSAKNGVSLLSSYDSNGVTISGTQNATNAGTYVITLTPNSNFAWSDGTTAPKNVSWTIAPMTITKPRFSGSTTFTYDGNFKAPVVVDFNSGYVNQTGTASAVQVGTHTAVYSLKSKQNTTWTDGTTADVNLSWTINPLKLTKPTISNTTFTYDGAEKSPSIGNYNPDYETISGSDTAINAGTYSLTFTLKDSTNTKWSDNTAVDLTYSWTINKATPTLTLSANSVTLDNINSTVTVAITYTGDGTITASTASTAPAIVSVTCDSQNVIITGLNFGTDTVTVITTGSSNYKEINSTYRKQITVNSKYLGTFENTSFEGIQYAAKNNLGDLYWDTGDSKTFELTGWAEGNKLTMIILDFNHNEAIEGSNTIHLAFVHSSSRYCAFYLDDEDGNDMSTHLGAYTSADAELGGYETSRIHKFFTSGYNSIKFQDILPADLKAVMKAVPKYISVVDKESRYQDNTGYHYTSKIKKMVSDPLIWLIGAEESGRASGVYTYAYDLQNYQDIYMYFVGGNRLDTMGARISLNQKANWAITNRIGNEVYLLTRDVAKAEILSDRPYDYYDEYFICNTKPFQTDNKLLICTARQTGLILPCFAIG